MTKASRVTVWRELMFLCRSPVVPVAHLLGHEVHEVGDEFVRVLAMLFLLD
jgi:hypothetical protein